MSFQSCFFSIIFFSFFLLLYTLTISGTIIVPIPAKNVQSPLRGDIILFVKLAKFCCQVSGGKTVNVRFDEAGTLTLMVLENVSPPLFVIEFGKEIVALTCKTTGKGVSFLISSLTFTFNIEFPEDKEGIFVLFGIK